MKKMVIACLAAGVGMLLPVLGQAQATGNTEPGLSDYGW